MSKNETTDAVTKVERKKQVRVTYGDAKAPLRSGSGGLFSLRCPLDISIPPKGTKRIGLGISFDLPALLMQSKQLESLALKNAGNVLDEGVEIFAELHNSGPVEVRIFENDIVCRVALLDNSHLEVT